MTKALSVRPQGTSLPLTGKQQSVHDSSGSLRRSCLLQYEGTVAPMDEYLHR